MDYASGCRVGQQPTLGPGACIEAEMARKDQAVEFLRRGLPPSAIAREMGTSTAAVMQYLCLKIGEGELRRSDLAFAIPHELRAAIEDIIRQSDSLNSALITRELRRRGIAANRLDVGVYVNYRRARVVLGDMYELLRTIEVRLHGFIKQAFVAEFGEEQWWRSGVPDNIRADCAALLEKDPEPAEESYCYTHLISLREILDKRWPVLSKYMPSHLLNAKKDLLERLLRMNRIRNAVMHPVRNAQLTEEEFEFVRDLEADLSDLKLHVAAEPVPLSHDLATASAPQELVSKLVPTAEPPLAPEDAATPEQAHEGSR